jgi:ATP-dependent Zn protease
MEVDIYLILFYIYKQRTNNNIFLSNSNCPDVGAEKIGNIFSTAKRLKSSIIFFDEIHDIRGNALTQLLLELDELKKCKKPIIVIGATNRPDLLDHYLLRNGRFDRHVVVPYPDMEGRRQILNDHLSKVCLFLRLKTIVPNCQLCINSVRLCVCVD